MRGDLYSGWLALADGFTPTLNTDDDPASLKPNESPACYGVDCTADGFLKTGSVLTGTARTAPTRTIGASTYSWYYDRVWRISSADLIYGAKYYDTVYVPQGFGKVTAEANIINFMPAFSNDIWVVTASGSHILSNAISATGQFNMGQFFQEAYVSTNTHATTVNGIPHFANVDGVFAWDGQKLKEYTRPIRDSLGSFVGAALTVDYSEQFLIGGTSYVIDMESGKLFDYGTSGFLFTSRTLTSRGLAPFQVDAIAFDLVYTSGDTGSITWQSKTECEDWFDEDDINLAYEEGKRSRIEVPINNSIRSERKFAIRITSLPAFVKIRSINVLVREFAQETPTA